MGDDCSDLLTLCSRHRDPLPSLRSLGIARAEDGGRKFVPLPSGVSDRGSGGWDAPPRSVRVKDRVAAPCARRHERRLSAASRTVNSGSARQGSDVTERRSLPIERKRLEACTLVATEALMEARLGLGKHARLVAG